MSALALWAAGVQLHEPGQVLGRAIAPGADSVKEAVRGD
jgi:hypothetical protein